MADNVGDNVGDVAGRARPFITTSSPFSVTRVKVRELSWPRRKTTPPPRPRMTRKTSRRVKVRRAR
ncbi:hypothetical protein [Corallococcus sicarius]|uniref:hypothetical protein n=1 Tax=Corallococcus sicarius TaxID=2316726 RepID=UPI0034E0D502